MASGVWPIRAITDGMFRPHQLTVVGGTGSGFYPTDTTLVITATPIDTNYVFLRWSDGDTDNPRTVQLTSDSTFTAVFENRLKSVHVSTWGYYYDASGELQVMYLQDTAMYMVEGWHTIKARTPVMGYHFTNWVWPDCYDNPRQVYITSDTSFNSIFYRSVVYLDINVNDTALGTTTRPSGNTRRDEYIEIAAEVKHPNAYLTSWTAPPLYGATAPISYVNIEGQNVIGYYFSETDTCAWPDTVHFMANFDTMSGNTVAYFPNAANNPAGSAFNSRNFDYEGLMQWGVKYDASAFRTNRFIRQVKVMVQNGTRDTLRIYQGGNEAPETLLYIHVLDYTGYSNPWCEWRTINLATTVEVDGLNPVWVVLSSDTYLPTSDQFAGAYTLYPCVRLGYTGNPNSALRYSPQQGWRPLRRDYDYEAGRHIVDLTSSNSIEVSWAVCLITAESAMDTYTLTVQSANTSMGSAEGGGTYDEGSTATLRANPRDGYRFTRWQDGNTQNPRNVTVTQNKTYTAYFEAIPPTYTVTLVSNNEDWGTVDGGGPYEAGTTIAIHAYPKTGYTFVQWSNGNTYAHANYTVTTDVTLTATFAPESTEGIEGVEGGNWKVYGEALTVVIEGAGNGVVTFYDVAGWRMATQQAVSGAVRFDVPAAGVYLVGVGSAPVRRVIVGGWR